MVNDYQQLNPADVPLEEVLNGVLEFFAEVKPAAMRACIGYPIDLERCVQFQLDLAGKKSLETAKPKVHEEDLVQMVKEPSSNWLDELSDLPPANRKVDPPPLSPSLDGLEALLSLRNPP